MSDLSNIIHFPIEPEEEKQKKNKKGPLLWSLVLNQMRKQGYGLAPASRNAESKSLPKYAIFPTKWLRTLSQACLLSSLFYIWILFRPNDINSESERRKKKKKEIQCITALLNGSFGKEKIKTEEIEGKK